jgi:isocitrate dehydrogenase (NAD+)
LEFFQKAIKELTAGLPSPSLQASLGKGIANPTALLQSPILILRHIEERVAADKIESAMFQIFEEGSIRTRDVGGTASTNEFADAIISKLGN